MQYAIGCDDVNRLSKLLVVDSLLCSKARALRIFTFTCRLPAAAASQGDRDYERLREAVIHIPIIHFPAMLRFRGIREVIP